jgi:hypothetical protein
MSLQEIKNNLYRKNPPEDLYARAESEFDARSAASGDKNVKEKFSPGSPDKWGEAPAENREQKRRKKIGLMVIGVVLLLGLALLIFLKIRQTSFDLGRVSLEIQGISEMKSGEVSTYEITYKNNNRATLKNVVLTLGYPENFLPVEDPNFTKNGLTMGSYQLENISSQAGGKITFRGRVYGTTDNLIYLKAELAFRPTAFGTTFVSKNQYRINIFSSSIKLEVSAPQNAATGDSVQYVFSYKNSGGEKFTGVRLRAEYPEKFSLETAEPMPSTENNIWNIGELWAGQEGKITIKGKIQGESGEIGVVRVYVENTANEKALSYTESRAETKISEPPLIIAQIVNDKVELYPNAGDTLNFQIGFKNNLTSDLSNLIVTESFASQVLDYTTLRLEKGGYFDMDKKVITWKAENNADLKELKAGNQGLIKFSIKVKDVLPINSKNDKNFLITSSVKIDSPDIPTPLNENKVIAGNNLEMKLNSKLVLGVQGFYTHSYVESFGPLPPVVGKETAYLIHWQALNIANDLASAKVEAILPTNVTLTGKVFPENIQLDFNQRNNMLTWNIGEMPAGTGITSPVAEVYFQIKLTPLPQQLDNAAALINKMTFSAQDLFTKQILQASLEEKTTYLFEDKTIQGKYKVKAAP